jgi:hypothetical protein
MADEAALVALATDLDKLEEKMCWCGAAGSGEGHTGWCSAEMFNRIPEDMYAPAALQWVKSQYNQASTQSESK